MGRRLGQLRERLTLQTNAPPTLAIATLTRSGDTATATFTDPHGLASKEFVRIADTIPVGYSGRFKITVVDEVTLTFTVDTSLATPATTLGTCTYLSDAQGGRRDFWRTVGTAEAELIPVRTMERLQSRVILAKIEYRFRIRTRDDVNETMRVRWKPSYLPAAERRTLEIHGVIPFEDGRSFLLIDCAQGV